MTQLEDQTFFRHGGTLGLIRGSASFTRFFVSGAFSRNNLDQYAKRISRFAFVNLDEYSDMQRSTGWVNIMDMFDTSFEGRTFFMHPYIALSFRVDVRKVPTNALKQHCREAEDKIKEAEDLEYLPKAKRKELKDFVWHQLLKRAIPRANTYDMIWNLETSLLIFGSTTNKVCDEFAEHFFKTFDLTLSPVFPYAIAHQHLEKEDEDTGLLDDLQAASLTDSPKEKH